MKTADSWLKSNQSKNRGISARHYDNSRSQKVQNGCMLSAVTESSGQCQKRNLSTVCWLQFLLQRPDYGLKEDACMWSARYCQQLKRCLRSIFSLKNVIMLKCEVKKRVFQVFEWAVSNDDSSWYKLRIGEISTHSFTYLWILDVCYDMILKLYFILFVD